MLGLDASCLEDWGEVKRAYRAAALESHPDKVGANAPPERVAAAANVFRAAKAAYDAICARRRSQHASAMSGVVVD